MDLTLTPEETKFRDELRAWLQFTQEMVAAGAPPVANILGLVPIGHTILHTRVAGM